MQADEVGKWGLKTTGGGNKKRGPRRKTRGQGDMDGGVRWSHSRETGPLFGCEGAGC